MTCIDTFWVITGYHEILYFKKREITKKNGNVSWYDDVLPPSLYSARAGEVSLPFTALVNKVWQSNKNRKNQGREGKAEMEILHRHMHIYAPKARFTV